MKASIILGLGLALAASGSFAQQPQTYHAKKSPPVREKKAPRVALPAKTSTSAAKDLHHIEQQSNKPLKMATPKPAPASAALKADKPAPMPPINATSGGMGTRTKTTGANQSKNPLKGRLRQKSTHQ